VGRVEWGGSPCTAETPTCTVRTCADKAGGSDLTNRVALAHTPAPSEQPDPRTTPKCPFVVLWTPCSCVEWGVLSRPSGFGEAARRASSPTNLAVAGSEQSLSILPDYTPTVRPPPKHC
jgi:hypothetical protein